jgi:hypothetical protein
MEGREDGTGEKHVGDGRVTAVVLPCVIIESHVVALPCVTVESRVVTVRPSRATPTGLPLPTQPPLMPCVAIESRVIAMRPSRATPTGLPLPTQPPPPPPATDACVRSSLVARKHFFSRGSEWRFLSGPWEGRKARICWDFYWGRPNRTVFYGLNHFFTDRIFSAGKAIFWPRIGPTERGPRLMIFRMRAFQWRTRISILSVHSEPKNWRI